MEHHDRGVLPEGKGQGPGYIQRGNGGKGGQENAQRNGKQARANGKGKGKGKGEGPGKGKGNDWKGNGKGKRKGKGGQVLWVPPASRGEGQIFKGKGKRENLPPPLGAAESEDLSFEEEKQVIMDLANMCRGPASWESNMANRDLEYRLRCASREARNDVDIALATLPICGLFLSEFTEAVRNDTDVVLAAVRSNRYALQFAGNQAAANPAIVLEAVRVSGFALQFAAPQLFANREICLLAARTSLEAVARADEQFQRDRDFMLETLKYQSTALQFASEELQADKELVMLALDGEGYALKYAGEELQADTEVVLKAVKNKGDAVHFASTELKRNKDFMILAARACRDDNQVHKCYEQADENLKLDISWRSFLQASRSPLAVPGEQAPILSVTLAVNYLENKGLFKAEATLLSGTSFTCDIEDLARKPNSKRPSRSGPILNDLATRLVSELPKHTEIEDLKHIFITFLMGDADSVLATVWDWNRSLSDFLPVCAT